MVRSSRSRPKPVDAGAPSGGDEDPVGRERCAPVHLPARPAAHRPRRTGRRPGRRVSDLDAQRPQAPGDRTGELGVVDRQDTVLRLDHRDLGAELGERRPELESDIAGADHDQALGNRLKRQGLGRGDDAPAERQRGHGRRHRAGRQHDVLGPDDLRTGVGLDPAGLAVDHHGVALHDLDPVPLQQRADAAREAADDAVLPVDRAREVDGRTLDPAGRTARTSPARPRDRRRRRHG